MNYIFVNGIMNNPGSAEGWTDRAVTWVHTHTPDRAEKFEYFCTPMFRRFGQRERADNLAKLLRSYYGQPLTLVGHSNGCDLICRALQLGMTTVARVLLFSGACDANFEANGLNEALSRGEVQLVECFRAGKDNAMKFAKVSLTCLSWCGLGYGTLGLTGPLKVDTLVLSPLVVRETVEPGFGHSTWFEAGNFAHTMKRVTGLSPYVPASPDIQTPI